MRPTFEADVIGNGAPQWFHPLRIAVRQNPGSIFLEHLSLQTFPNLEGKITRFWYAWSEWAWRQKIALAATLEHRATALADAQCFIASSRAPRRASSGETFCPFRYEAAAANTPLNETFRMQLAIGRLDRIAGNVQRFRQGTRSRQRLTDVKRAIQDQLPDTSLYTRIHRQGVMCRVANPGFDGL